jgi:hypothetical protein
MSIERWDAAFRFLDGPMALLDEQVFMGPVIRMGANPAPGDIRLSGYKGLDDRHVAITTYDGQSVIAPIGTAQVRVAPHPHVEWRDILPLQGAMPLNDGAAIHLGPVGRGITFTFIEARRLGTWVERSILAESAQAVPEAESSRIQEVSTQRLPPWFIGGIVMIGVITAVAVLVPVLNRWVKPIPELGPRDEGVEYYTYVNLTEEISAELLEGMDQPIAEFVMIPNAQAAGMDAMGQDPKKWDQRLRDAVARSVKLHSNGFAFWRRLEEITNDYSAVVQALRDAGMPEVIAAIPYIESQYRSEARSPVCAQGYWQLMPEYGPRFGFPVRNCKLKHTSELWTPTRKTPPNQLFKRAEYIHEEKCAILSCEQDGRKDLATSTRASIASLKEAYDDPVLKASGSLVQIVITAHNAGYWDEKIDGGAKSWNIRPAYDTYRKLNPGISGVNFIGDNLKCPTVSFSTDRCGSLLFDQAQHYGYNVIAEHILAVCYYAINHPDNPVFQKWEKYTTGRGYCKRASIPDVQSVKSGKKK